MLRSRSWASQGGIVSKEPDVSKIINHEDLNKKSRPGEEVYDNKPGPQGEDEQGADHQGKERISILIISTTDNIATTRTGREWRKL